MSLLEQPDKVTMIPTAFELMNIWAVTQDQGGKFGNCADNP